MIALVVAAALASIGGYAHVGTKSTHRLASAGRTDAAVTALDGLGGLPRTSTDDLIAPPPDHFEGPVASEPPPAELARRVSRVTPSGGTWAVVIGINDYPGTSHDLHYAVADAQDVNLALANMGVPADHRLLVTNGQASAAVVARSADWLVAHAGPDAVAVFFYAGHVRKLTSTTEEIVGADGNSLTDGALADHLRPLRAAHTWLAIASCYGGGFTEALGPGRVLTAAAGPNGLAYENPSFGRSYMVQFMIREAMINLRAPGSVQDAFSFARTEIARDYPGREPVEYDDNGGPLSLRPPGGGPAPAPAPAPAGSSGSTSPSPQSPPPSGSGSSGSGSGSGGSGSSGSSPNCKAITLGVVHCS